MSARSIGELAFGLAARKTVRSFQPVRRDSATAGECEQQVWTPLAASARDARRIIAVRMNAAERYDRSRKEPGCRNGALGHIALEVLRELYRMIDYRTGRLDPAIATLCERLRRSRAAVVAAMARLREHGFLKWIRRYEPTDNPGAGPQIRQVTNAYGLTVPRMIAEQIKRIIGPAPVPDCERQRRDDDARQVEDWLASASAHEVVAYTVKDVELGGILERIFARNEELSASSPGGQKPCSSLY